MDTDPSGSGGWRFAQCFGDKGEVEDITEGVHYSSPLARLIEPSLIQSCVGQPILSQRLSSIQPEIIWQRGIRVVESFSLSAMNRYVHRSPAPLMVAVINQLSVYLCASSIIEKGLRVQILYRVSIARTRVRLSQITRDRGEDKQDKMVQTTERRPFFAIDEWSVWFSSRMRDVPKFPHQTKRSNSGKYLRNRCG
jgi:hypothetical protein